jgi:hypothetical protein
MFVSFRKHCVLLLLFCLCAFASQSVFANSDWREISPAELQMKTPKVEPDADAEAIFWEVRIDDSSADNLSLNHYVRVKIFNERGREKYSKFDIPYTRGIKIKDIAARVIKPDGSFVEIKKEDIFDREIVKAGKIKIKARSFAVSNIEPGVIVEYRYREVIEDGAARGMQLQFQRDIPVQNLSYYYKPFRKREPSYQAYNFTDTKFVKDEKGFYLAQRMNVPSFKEEPMMPPENMVRPWMLLSGASLEVTGVSAFSISFMVKDPSNPASYWGAVGREKSGWVKFMNKPDKEIKKVAQEITASVSSPEAKISKLYEYVQTQIKNTSFDASLTDEDRKKLPKIKELSDVLKHKHANVQFVDMLFGAMANSLGYDTRIALVANRSKMFFDPNMTNESFIQPAAIAVKVGDNWKFFNPGVKFLPEGMLAWYEEGVWALLVGEKEFLWQRTPLTGFEKTKATRSANLTLLEDGTLAGSVQIEYVGQTALQNRIDNFEVSLEKQKENLTEEIKVRLKTAEVTNVSIENFDDAHKPLVHKFDVRIPNYAQKTGKRLFLQPGFFEYGENPLFSDSKRKYDIYFQYPWSEEDKIQINLPKGFELDNADAPHEVADPAKIGFLKVKMSVARDMSYLMYNRNFYFGGGANFLFQSASYQPLKNLFDEFHRADSHAVTLKQK